MKALLIGLLLAAAPLAALAATPATPEVAGDWEGKLNADGATLRVVFHVGDKVTTADSPDQEALGLPAELSHTGDKWAIDVASVGARYEGVVKGDAWTGALSQNGVDMPLNLTRKPAAKPAP
jgi:hypothetical protein